MEYHIFLIYQKLTVQDFSFQLFGILRESALRFDGSPLLYLIFYSNLSGCGVCMEIFQTPFKVYQMFKRLTAFKEGPQL